MDSSVQPTVARITSVETDAIALLVEAHLVLWAENSSVSMPAWPNMVLTQRPIVDEVTALYGLMYDTSNLVEFLKVHLTPKIFFG